MSTTNVEHCAMHIQRLSTEIGWDLPDTAVVSYARRIIEAWPRAALLGDLQLRTIIVNYHLDHRIVEALRDACDAEHEQNWNQWIRQATHILSARYANIREANAATMSEHDLTQEAMLDLWNALRSFRYESRFHTWAFTVISNCYIRVYRSAHTQKRCAKQGLVSLEDLVEQNDSIADSERRTPEEVAVGTALADLVAEVLTQHPDKRLYRIFQLWANDDKPLRVIGEQLQLSIPRVHALLTQALKVLRREDRLRAWDDAEII